MKRLKQIDRETWLVILAPLGISLLASLVSVVVTRSSEYFVFILTTFFLLSLFGIIMWFQSGRHLKKVDEVLQHHLQEEESALDRRLPEIKFILGDKVGLEFEIVNTVRQARSFIAATGGKARIKDYLEAIESKILSESVRYTRIVPGDPERQPEFAIRHELCEHLCKLLADPQGRRLTTILRTDTLDIGYYLVTDSGFIIFMPNPRPKTPFDSCISMPGRPEISDRYREYIVEIIGGTATEKITTQRDIRKLCQECRKRIKKPHADAL